MNFENESEFAQQLIGLLKEMSKHGKPMILLAKGDNTFEDKIVLRIESNKYSSSGKVPRGIAEVDINGFSDAIEKIVETLQAPPMCSICGIKEAMPFSHTCDSEDCIPF